MTGYRLYFVDQKGHIRGAREFLAADDQAAVASAAAQLAGEAAELWERARRVRSFAQAGPAISVEQGARPPRRSGEPQSIVTTIFPSA